MRDGTDRNGRQPLISYSGIEEYRRIMVCKKCESSRYQGVVKPLFVLL